VVPSLRAALLTTLPITVRGLWATRRLGQLVARLSAPSCVEQCEVVPYRPSFGDTPIGEPIGELRCLSVGATRNLDTPEGHVCPLVFAYAEASLVPACQRPPGEAHD
jgi:hypothetical protein